MDEAQDTVNMYSSYLRILFSGFSQVRMSINRRIEMPPAFLFPESDPPPFDLVPEHPSSQASANTTTTSSTTTICPGKGPFRNQPPIVFLNEPQQQRLNQSNGDNGDSTDANSLSHNNNPSQLLAEEYTLPDLFPNPPQVNSITSSSKMTNNNEESLKLNFQNYAPTVSNLQLV